MDEHANKDLLSLEAGILNLELSPMTAISSVDNPRHCLPVAVRSWIFGQSGHSASVRMHKLFLARLQTMLYGPQLAVLQERPVVLGRERGRVLRRSLFVETANARIYART